MASFLTSGFWLLAFGFNCKSEWLGEMLGSLFPWLNVEVKSVGLGRNKEVENHELHVYGGRLGSEDMFHSQGT